MRSTEREDDDRYRSASFAHARHRRHVSSNCAFDADDGPVGCVGQSRKGQHRENGGPPVWKPEEARRPTRSYAGWLPRAITR